MEIGVLHSVLWNGNRLFCTPFYGTETGIFVLHFMECYEMKVKHKTFKRFRNDSKKIMQWFPNDYVTSTFDRAYSKLVLCAS